MDRGIYAAASGGLLNTTRLDVIANNLANLNTVGFKAQRLAARQQQFSETLASSLPNISAQAQGDFTQTPAVMQDGIYTDFSPGPISETGNPLHVALSKPNQFFVVTTPQGEAYTRAGNFSLNAEGTLVTADGLEVQGDGGAITLPPGEVSITSNGSVVVNKEVVARLRVAEIEDTKQLQRIEGVRFILRNAQANTVPAEVVPRSIEMANINPVQAMVDMINANRAFEAYSKSARTIDDLNTEALRVSRSTG